jgi:hypothetical protein
VWWRTTLIVAAVLMAILPVARPAVETYYSNRAFPILQHWLTDLSNRVPFALLDVLLVGAALWWVVTIVVDLAGRRSFPRVFLRLVLRTATMAAVVYLWFAVVWGLNYRRMPLPAKIQFDEKSITPAASRELARRAVDEVNALYVSAHSELALTGGGAGRRLEEAFAHAQGALGVQRSALPARPKRTLLDAYFRAAGVEGMTDPLFLEILIARGLLPFEEPFVIAHEWSHLAGFTDEGEANFVGWLTCLRGTDAAKYSGWLFLYSQVIAGLPPADRANIVGRLGPGPAKDLQAIAERVKQELRPEISAVGWRVYDQYLKANRIEAGTASYAEVVRLILGSRSSGLF